MHTKCTYERTQSTSEPTARQRLRGQPNLTPRSSVLLPVRITTARRPDHIRLSALVWSQSTQFIVHVSSQLGHAGPCPPETRSFFEKVKIKNQLLLWIFACRARCVFIDVCFLLFLFCLHICVCVCFQIHGPLRECRSIRSGASLLHTTEREPQPDSVRLRSRFFNLRVFIKE